MQLGIAFVTTVMVISLFAYGEKVGQLGPDPGAKEAKRREWLAHEPIAKHGDEKEESPLEKKVDTFKHSTFTHNPSREIQNPNQKLIQEIREARQIFEWSKKNGGVGEQAVKVDRMLHRIESDLKKLESGGELEKNSFLKFFSLRPEVNDEDTKAIHSMIHFLATYQKEQPRVDEKDPDRSMLARAFQENPDPKKTRELLAAARAMEKFRSELNRSGFDPKASQATASPPQLFMREFAGLHSDEQKPISKLNDQDLMIRSSGIEIFVSSLHDMMFKDQAREKSH